VLHESRHGDGIVSDNKLSGHGSPTLMFICCRGPTVLLYASFTLVYSIVSPFAVSLRPLACLVWLCDRYVIL